MEVTGEFTVDATPEQIWTIITDPDELEQCIPGAESIERTSEDTYEGTISRTVAGHTLSLSGTVEVVEEEAYERMAARVSADNTSAGSWTKVTADAEMDITSSGAESTLTYTVGADISGKLASLGSSLVKPTAQSDIESYFESVEERAKQA
jgi:carbon monoxide dehydrogenase subunit G